VQFAPEFSWPRFICWARTGLAVAALGVAYWWPPHATPLLYSVFGVFFAYAVALAIRCQWQSGTLGLLALFADTVFFLILSGFGGATMVWVSSAFFLYLLAEALVFYGPVEVAVVAVVCAVFCLALPYAAIRQLGPPIAIGGVLALAFAVSKQRFSGRAAELNAQLKQIERTSEKSVEDERQRIASDFHDGPLQSFISLQMRLEILRKLLERDRNAGMDDLKQLQVLALTQIRDLRSFLHSMRPVDMEGANLMASARRTAESFQKESGIPVTFLGANSPVGLPQEMSSEVLQMLREALHNVQKHAGATRVAVAMEKTDRGLEISVDDNGHGFNFAGTYTLEELEMLRLGPASLKRRARTLNADLVLESRPGRGTGLKFRVPLQ
jgi:signal transduction histidine kinase